MREWEFASKWGKRQKSLTRCRPLQFYKTMISFFHLSETYQDCQRSSQKETKTETSSKGHSYSMETARSGFHMLHVSKTTNTQVTNRTRMSVRVILIQRTREGHQSEEETSTTSRRSTLMPREWAVTIFSRYGTSITELIISVNIVDVRMTPLRQILLVSVIEMPVKFNIGSAYIWLHPCVLEILTASSHSISAIRSTLKKGRNFSEGSSILNLKRSIHHRSIPSQRLIKGTSASTEIER